MTALPAPRFCDGPAGRVAYTRQGSGPSVTLLHPIGVDRLWWDGYVRAWAGSHDVIAIDFRGHGASAPLAAPVTLSDHAADVAAVLRAEGVADTALAGVSMGGMVAQYVAIEHPGLARALILCGTAGGFPDDVRPRIRARGDTSRAGDMAEVVDDTIDRWFLPSRPRPDLVERCRECLLADDWYGWSANWEAIARLDTLGGLPGVRVPALVVAGEADASIPPAVSRRIADALPDARFVAVPGASHFGAFEAPETFLPLFGQFLRDTA